MEVEGRKGDTILTGADELCHDEAFRARAMPIPVSGKVPSPPESRRQQGHWSSKMVVIRELKQQNRGAGPSGHWFCGRRFRLGEASGAAWLVGLGLLTYKRPELTGF
jgi:hypothetical protein